MPSVAGDIRLRIVFLSVRTGMKSYRSNYHWSDMTSFRYAARKPDKKTDITATEPPEIMLTIPINPFAPPGEIISAPVRPAPRAALTDSR